MTDQANLPMDLAPFLSGPLADAQRTYLAALAKHFGSENEWRTLTVRFKALPDGSIAIDYQALTADPK